MGRIVEGDCCEQHLDFSGRLELVPRLLLLANMNRSEYPADAHCQKVESGLQTHAREKASSRDILESPSAVTLSDHLRFVYQQGVRQYRTRLRREHPADRFLMSAIDRFRASASNVRCERCGKDAGRVCDGRSREADAALVRAKGECWRWFQEIFFAAVSDANRHYSKLARGFRGLPNIEVAFRTTPLPEVDSRSSESKASTIIEDGVGGLRSIVEIRLPIKHFDHHTFFNLPYKLYHEIIVHSVQGAKVWHRGIGQHKRLYGSVCPFAEGVVDSAAHDILRRHLKGSRSKRSSMHAFKGKILKAMKFQKSARETGVLEEIASDAAVSARAYGCEVYSKLKQHIGEEDTLRCVLTLNLEDLSPAERREMMEAFNILVEGGGVVAGRDGLMEVALDYVREYLEVGRVRTLVNQLREL